MKKKKTLRVHKLMMMSVCIDEFLYHSISNDDEYL